MVQELSIGELSRRTGLLETAEVAARLALEGEERVFCSEECLRRFVASPERYSS